MQAALPFLDTAAPHAWADAGGTGFAIGWDHARHRLTPPVEHLQAGNPLRRGWEAGRATFGARTQRVTPQLRQWLQLRVDAWLRGRAFDALHVTPALLLRLGGTHCPVTREPLDAAAAVLRANRDAGYAAGNLVRLGARAASGLGERTCADLLPVARRLGPSERVDGLDADAWLRLAVLVSFATPLRHEQAAELPLVVLPPPRLRLLNAAQALQLVLTWPFAGEGYARRIDDLVALAPEAEARHELRLFLHTLLARRIAAGAPAAGTARQALEDLWRDELLQRRWQRLALHLGAAGCERAVQAAERRGLAAALRWLPADRATDGWALSSRGHVGAAPDAVAEPAPQGRAAQFQRGRTAGVANSRPTTARA
jgi:hypothetical protein